MGAAQHAGILFPALKFSALVLSFGVVSAAFAAPPDVTSLYPAGGAMGEEASVTATGSFANWPVQISTSDARLQVECEKDKGKLKIRVATEAAPGIAWLRFMDGEGASAPRPFIIAAQQPSLLEKEPNDSTKQAQPASLPVVVHGKYDKNGDSDAYAVQLTAGQTVVASLQSNEILGSPADGALQICNEAGQVLAMNQDAGGLDSLLAFTAKSDGKYLVRTFALPATPNSSVNFAGGELFIYRLTITTGAFADATLPLAIPRGQATPLKLVGWNVPAEPQMAIEPEKQWIEPWYWSPPTAAGLVQLKAVDLPCLIADPKAASGEGQAIEIPACISGVIAERRDVHRFKFTGMKGTKLSIAVESQSLYDLDPLLKLTNANGQPVTEADDTGKQRDPTINATLAADGDYVIELRDLHRSGGPRHAYRLTIDSPQPKLGLTVTAGNHLISAGESLEIPVTINRQNGFSGEVKIDAVNLPRGVSVEAATSSNKGDTAKQVKLKFIADREAQAGQIRIVARDESGNEVATGTFVQTLGSSTFQHASIWLAVKGSK